MYYTLYINNQSNNIDWRTWLWRGYTERKIIIPEIQFYETWISKEFKTLTFLKESKNQMLQTTTKQDNLSLDREFGKFSDNFSLMSAFQVTVDFSGHKTSFNFGISSWKSPRFLPYKEDNIINGISISELCVLLSVLSTRHSGLPRAASGTRSSPLGAHLSQITDWSLFLPFLLCLFLLSSLLVCKWKTDLIKRLCISFVKIKMRNRIFYLLLFAGFPQ